MHSFNTLSHNVLRENHKISLCYVFQGYIKPLIKDCTAKLGDFASYQTSSVVLRSRKSKKDRQYYCQKGNKKTNNYLQAPHRKTEIEQHELHMKAGGLAL